MTASTAEACWLVEPGCAELRTETLLYRGEVPASDFERMRAPFLRATSQAR